MDLTAQPVAPYLAAATTRAVGSGFTGKYSGRPVRAFKLCFSTSWSGVAAFKSGDLVVRAGYGIFTSSYRGNITASQIIAPPYWTYESQTWSPAQLQRWETAWPVNPTSFVAPSVGAAAYDVKPMKDHEWNVSVQKTCRSIAVTVSYVGSYGDGLVRKLFEQCAAGLLHGSPGGQALPCIRQDRFV